MTLDAIAITAITAKSAAPASIIFITLVPFDGEKEEPTEQQQRTIANSTTAKFWTQS